MDRLIAERKLDSLQRCLQRVRARRPQTVAALLTDIDGQDVLVLNLSRAVQICVDLAVHLIAHTGLAPPDTMGQAFDRLEQAGILEPELTLRMQKAVGFRNIAVHAYDDIDFDIVWHIANRHLTDFEAFARVIARRLDNP